MSFPFSRHHSLNHQASLITKPGPWGGLKSGPRPSGLSNRQAPPLRTRQPPSPAPQDSTAAKPRPSGLDNSQVPPHETVQQPGSAPLNASTVRPAPRDTLTARPRSACVRGPAETCRLPRSPRLRWQQPGQYGTAADAGADGVVAIARAAGPDGDGGGSAGVAARGGGDPVRGLVGSGRVGATQGDLAPGLPVVGPAVGARGWAGLPLGLSSSSCGMSLTS